MKILYLCGDVLSRLPLMMAFQQDPRVYDDPNDIRAVSGSVDEGMLRWADFIVSFGYRHILSKEVCERFDGRAVNLHIGYLPFNRGAHPVVWSVLDGTPAGVTLHYMSEGLDKGDLVAQRIVELDDADTFKTVYDKHETAAVALFTEIWPLLKAGKAPRTKQRGQGTYHRVSDLVPLPMGWDTPIREVACV